MYCKICNRYTRGSNDETCKHYEPTNIYAEVNKAGQYYLTEKYSGGLRAQGKFRHWPVTKGMTWATSAEAYKYAWQVKNNLIPKGGD